METATDIVTLLCATSSPEEAARLAEALIARRLAACVQAVPITSWYRWEGAVTHSAEVLLLIKTTRAAAPAAEALLHAEHSYALPEIIRLPIEGGLADYLAWVRGEVAGPGGDG